MKFTIECEKGRMRLKNLPLAIFLLTVFLGVALGIGLGLSWFLFRNTEVSFAAHLFMGISLVGFLIGIGQAAELFIDALRIKGR